jgi:hypothetical protein
VLEFGSIIFNSQTISLDKKIETIQRKITRMIFRRCHPNQSVIPPYLFRCKALNLQTLKLRRDIFDLIFFHNLHLHPGLVSHKNMPQPKSHRFSLRKKGTFLQPHVRTSLRPNSFFVFHLLKINLIVIRNFKSTSFSTRKYRPIWFRPELTLTFAICLFLLYALYAVDISCSCALCV